MSPLMQIARFFWSGQRAALLRGWVLSLTVLLSGAALLGLSGWFITASAIAGIVGIGIDFDVFRPSAGVRLLALGRTAARYGERLLTHDATLRALAELRVRLLRHRLGLSFERLEHLRGALALNRLTADVDALDGLPLRLILPVTAALGAYATSFAMLWWLVDLRVALWIVAGFTFGAALALWPAARAAFRPSRLAEQAQQAMRARLIDLLRARQDLTVYGRLAVEESRVMEAEHRGARARAELDRIERRAGLILQLTATAVAAGVLALGGEIVLSGEIGAPLAALGFFVALALVEGLMPLRRAAAEIGRMRDAARRVAPEIAPDSASETGRQRAGEGALAPAPPATPGIRPDAPALALCDLRFQRTGAHAPLFEGVSLTLKAGETCALTGRSGAGKSTVLSIAAGLIAPQGGTVALFGAPLADWPVPDMRREIGMLPQRSALLSGTVLDALRLGAPELSAAEAWAALEAVALADVIESRGGLELRLGESGRGLSGGESRRLALARVLVRRPSVLLLDEATEGLDAETSVKVLKGLRFMRSDTAILMASHRKEEIAFADKSYRLKRS